MHSPHPNPEFLTHPFKPLKLRELLGIELADLGPVVMYFLNFMLLAASDTTALTLPPQIDTPFQAAAKCPKGTSSRGSSRPN